MGRARYALALFLCTFSLCFCGEREHMYYFLAKNNIDKALTLYNAQYQATHKHDPEFIEDLAMHILQNGIKNDTPEIQLLSLYGVSFGSTNNAITLCDLAMRNGGPMTQLATIHLLGQLQDDRCEELFVRAFSSQFLQIRFEAGFQLAVRKAKQATGLFQSLMHHLPVDFHVFFPDLFALVGTKDALSQLQKMMTHKNKRVQLATILAVAKHKRDDFLPQIRSLLTHRDPAEQEAAIYAVGMLQDLDSKPVLDTLKNAPLPNVRIAAYASLIALGDHTVFEQIKAFATHKNPFAISLLRLVPTAQDTLASMLFDADRTVRFNAALALLPHRDPRAIPTLLEIILSDEKDYGMYPITSLGGTMTSWKIVPSKNAFDKVARTNVTAITTSFREHLLHECAQYSEPSFLRIVKEIFQREQNDLIPTAVNLVEAIGSKEAKLLLKKYAERAGAPLLRDYCRLALYRMGALQGSLLTEWLEKKSHQPLIRFRPLLTRAEQTTEGSSFALTPEEESRLYIETLLSIADKHSAEGLEMLLQVIHKGDAHNKYAIAGLLLHAIQ